MLYLPNITAQDDSFVPWRKFNLATEFCPDFFLPHPLKYKCTLVLRTSTSGASSELHSGLCNKFEPPDSNTSDLWRKRDLINNFTVLVISARNEGAKDSFCLVSILEGKEKSGIHSALLHGIYLSSCICHVLLCTTTKHKHNRLYATSTSERTKPM